MSQFERDIAKVAAILEGTYNKADLDTAFRQAVKTFLKTQEQLARSQGVTQADFDLTLTNSLPKAKASRLYAIPFATATLYHAFLKTLPDEVQKVWSELLWADEMSAKAIEKTTGVKVYTIEKYSWRPGQVEERMHFDPRFNIFNFKGGYRSYGSSELTLWLPESLRKLLAQYYPVPPEAVLRPLKEIPATTHRFVDNERDILMELPRLLTYKDQGQIAVTGKDRPAHTTLTKMQRSLNLREFYPEAAEKKLRLLRTQLLAGLLVNPQLRKAYAPDAPQYLRVLFQKIYTAHTHSPAIVLTDLKGLGHLDDHYFEREEARVFKFFAALPAGEWFSFENIRLHLKFKLEKFKPVSTWTAANKLFFEYKDENENTWNDKHYITAGLYYDAVELPFLMGSFFLFAAFGLCELAYHETDLEDLGRSTYSSWEGLAYLRMTALGAYVTGQTNTFDTSNLAAPSKINLSPDTLLIATEEADVAAATILEPYTERVGVNRFRTDNQIFLKNIRSKKELEGKISLFKQVVGSELPPNWQTFFQELLHKIDPFESAGDLHVFKIPADNKTLIQLIAQDPVLKNAVIKAEGFHLLVSKERYPVFRKRLQEFGYLLT